MARLYKLTSGKARLSTWGPKFEGMKEAFTDHDLPVGCALQWKRCVEKSIGQLTEVPASQVLTIKYEDFTADPSNELQEICQFLGTATDGIDFQALTSGVSSRSVGNWKKQLLPAHVDEINRLAGDLLKKLGYGKAEVSSGEASSTT